MYGSGVEEEGTKIKFQEKKISYQRRIYSIHL